MTKTHQCILQRKSYLSVAADTIRADGAARNQSDYQADCFWQALATQKAYWAKRAERGI